MKKRWCLTLHDVQARCPICDERLCYVEGEIDRSEMEVEARPVNVPYLAPSQWRSSRCGHWWIGQISVRYEWAHVGDAWDLYPPPPVLVGTYVSWDDVVEVGEGAGNALGAHPH